MGIEGDQRRNEAISGKEGPMMRIHWDPKHTHRIIIYTAEHNQVKLADVLLT